MEESKASSFETTPPAGRLSTTFLLLSPPPLKEAAGGCPEGIQAEKSPLQHHNLDNLPPSDCANFPDDEVEDEEDPSHLRPPDERRGQEEGGVSMDSIGRVSVGSADNHGLSSINAARHELSPIPFSSARGSDAHQLPEPPSEGRQFFVEEAGVGPDDESFGREEDEMRVAAAAEVRREPSTAEMTPASPPPRRGNDNVDDSSPNEEEQRDDANNSMLSKEGSVASKRSSVGELEMERMTEELGASSMEFIRRIRAAAFRRKLDVTRSRDTHAAKERERQEALAAERAAAQLKAKDRRQSEPATRLNTIESDTHAAASPSRLKSLFHARPVPKTTGPKGNGGLAGVPKVAKKPTTVPQSPLLGSRRGRQPQRRQKDELPPQPTLDDDSDSSRSPSPTRDQNIFRALPMPKSSTCSGHAGMTGVPKVPKRPSTVPQSPLLGGRRRPGRGTPQGNGVVIGTGAATKGIPTVKKRPTTVPRSPLLGFRRFAKQTTSTASASNGTDVTSPGPSDSQQGTRRSMSSPLSTSTSVTPLIGLHLLESGSEIEVPTPSSRNQDRPHRSGPELHDGRSANPGIAPRHSDEEYRPHSTARAAERAEFEARKAEMEKERQETLSRLRRQQVKELKREMRALRSNLS